MSEGQIFRADLAADLLEPGVCNVAAHLEEALPAQDIGGRFVYLVEGHDVTKLRKPVAHGEDLLQLFAILDEDQFGIAVLEYVSDC